MKNNYDLILNFKTKDGKSLDKESIDAILTQARYLANMVEDRHGVLFMKAIISQAVDSRRLDE